MISTRGALSCGAAALAVVVVVGGVAYRSEPELAGWRELAELLDGHRPFRPRLTLQVDETEGGPTVAAPDPQALARLARRVAAEAGDPHLTGVLRLLTAAGREGLDRAVEDLTRATSARPTDPAPYVDLTAAHLVRAEREGDPEHHVAALAASRRAVELAPESAAALYNRAVALDDLGLVRGAASAWRAFVAVEAEGVWADEARERLAVLEAPSRRDQWAALVADPSIRTLAPEALRERIEGFPQEAREHAMEVLLPEWADAHLAEHPAAADAALDFSRSIGGQLRDRTVADVVTSIETADDDSRRRIAEGLIAYREGRRLFTARDTADARRSLEESRERFLAAGCGLWAWAEVWIAGSHVLHSEFVTFDRRLAALDETASWEGWHSLRGRVAWTTGLAAIRRGRPDLAVGSYSAARRAFELSGEDEDEAGMAALLAEVFEWVGEYDRAWQHRLESLQALMPWPLSTRRHNLLWEAGAACSKRAFADAALDFLDEDVLLAEDVLDPVLLADAFTHRATHSIRSRDARSAGHDLSRALRAAATIPAPSLRVRLEMLARRREAQMLLESDPSAALATSDAVSRYYQDNDLSFRQAEVLLTRAHARVALGDIAGGEHDLLQAVSLVEEEGEGIADAATRRRYQETSQEVYEAVVLFYLDQRRDPAEALRFVRRARSARPDDGATPTPRSSGRTVVVEYFFAGPRLLIWTASQHGLRSWSEIVDRNRMTEQVARLVTALRQDRSEREIARLSGAIYEHVLAPFMSEVPARSRIVIVPDGPLYRLPFAALRASAEDPYLIETHPVAVSPGLPLLDARPAGRDHGEAPSRVLLVGDPSLAGVDDLPPLPRARAEVTSLARLYDDAELLVGDAARLPHVLSELPRARIAHFATHAHFDPWAPERSGLYLATEAGRPILLRPSDVSAARLDAVEVVVLSGCATAAVAGDRADLHMALGRALLERGVGTVIGTMWPLADEDAGSLATRIHDRLLAGSDPASAIREVQLGEVARTRRNGPASMAWSGLAVLSRSP